MAKVLKSKQKYLTSAAPPLASRPNSGEKPLDTFPGRGYLCPRYSLIVQFQFFITMGRKNLILGNASGKLGDVVFYRDGGEQRFRTRVTPANPQSMAQQSQRSRLGGVTNTFRALKGILADSFESKAVNQSAFNAFAASALPTAPYLSKEMVSDGCALPMPMAISKGSLPQLEGVFSSMQDDEIMFDTFDMAVPNVSSTTVTTVGKLSEALIAWKPCMFANGAKFNIVIVNYDALASNVEGGYKPSLKLISFVLDTASTQTLEQAFGQGAVVITPNLISFVLNVNTVTSVYGAFVSTDAGGDGLKVSSATAHLNEAAQTLYEGAITDAARIAAAESYGGSNQRCVL